jgi:hypothetical protein
MDYISLLYSAQFGLGAFLFYKLHKWWANMIKKKSEAFFKPDLYLRKFTHWIIILGLTIASVIYFLKSIKWL